MRARTMADTYQARARRNDIVMHFIAHSGSSNRREERRITTILSEEALTAMSLSAVTSFKESLQLNQEN